MPRTAKQNQIIKDKRRKKLLDKALEVFATIGYDEVTIDDITKAAKCSHGLFYHYFVSKEDAYIAILQEYVAPNGVEAAIPLKKAESLGGAKGLKCIAEACEKLSGGSRTNLLAARLVVTMPQQTKSTALDKKYLGNPDIFKTLKKLIIEGQKTGEVINGSPDEIACAFSDMAAGSLERKLFKNSSKKTIVTSDVITAMIFKK